jgi:hypothetical protein
VAVAGMVAAELAEAAVVVAAAVAAVVALAQIR